VRLSNKELESIVPRQENSGNDFLDTFFLEFQSFSSDYRGVDEVKSQSVSTEFVNDNARLRIVLQTLGHLFAIAIWK
jgi:hypothetical protein